MRQLKWVLWWRGGARLQVCQMKTFSFTTRVVFLRVLRPKRRPYLADIIVVASVQGVQGTRIDNGSVPLKSEYVKAVTYLGATNGCSPTLTHS